MSTFRIVPDAERPYEWALSEFKLRFADNKVKLSLDSLVIKPGTHVSLFHKEGGIDIYRCFWEDTRSVIYYQITNFKELQEQHPEIVQLLLNNGTAAYQQLVAQREEAKELGRKVPYYEPLLPLRKTE